MSTELDRDLGWLRQGTARCQELAAALADRDTAAASALPGWSRAHLLTHLARNADALVNLLTWARTRVPTPMYASAARRTADIEAGAGRTAGALRADLAATGDRLAAAIAAMAPADWDTRVRTAHGRELPARRVPWLRVREVWIHAVDLARGATVRDLPDQLVDALLDEVCATFTARFASSGQGPPLRLTPTDRSRHWTIGGPGPGPGPGAGPVVLTAPAADLVGWLIGRPAAEPPVATGGDLPELPPWL